MNSIIVLEIEPKELSTHYLICLHFPQKKLNK